MKINLISTGRLKEEYLKDAQKSLLGSINKKNNIKINTFELQDEAIKDNPSPLEEVKIKDIESARVIDLINSEQIGRKNTYLVILDLTGKLIKDKDFINIKNKALENDLESITFVIGGSLGNSESLLKISNLKIKLSNLTYPHQLFKIALLEAINKHF